jgi:hypothetical protein
LYIPSGSLQALVSKYGRREGTVLASGERHSLELLVVSRVLFDEFLRPSLEAIQWFTKDEYASAHDWAMNKAENDPGAVPSLQQVLIDNGAPPSVRHQGHQTLRLWSVLRRLCHMVIFVMRLDHLHFINKGVSVLKGFGWCSEDIAVGHYRHRLLFVHRSSAARSASQQQKTEQGLSSEESKKLHVQAAASAWKVKVGNARERKVAAIARAKKAVEMHPAEWKAKMCVGQKMRGDKPQVMRDDEQPQVMRDDEQPITATAAVVAAKPTRGGGGGFSGGHLVAGLVATAVHGMDTGTRVGGSTAARERFLQLATPLHQQHCDELPFEDEHFHGTEGTQHTLSTALAHSSIRTARRWTRWDVHHPR